ncbi:hypothetical protein I3843_07G199400 [Carya illinoinensis]|uniref:DUF1677 family protein n=1 Tax=Carya illinoinensis TaxID=32201 RepID=A0A8T1PXP3_CARIL|nr:uncharacterized protein LOC122316408 [Carya illinoinensis]KAG2699630.1 hypothetical protein I3760_07G200200 [Carya illinoinensis]KAG6649309.1 hypothetical protein CIPAW_07G203200 [Carya illinoinensis]KAG6706008.1 hypothetical protein I3842_07G205900 [Carya illinoinensis]KAG7972759.1 hypothetical protein I3843_07G199400 [Carya illinoinensis]
MASSLTEVEIRLRKVVSNISVEIEKYSKELETIGIVNEVEQAECKCCGLKEDCTPAYIVEVQEYYSGNWVCGLCSEAVKERLIRAPKTSTGDAVASHREFFQKFNNTARLNPNLSLACKLRDIAKRSCENRSSKNSSMTKLARSTSCFPKIDLRD